MQHPVGFTDTAKQDVRDFVADPSRHIVLARAIIARLGFFPMAHRPCPAFGPQARFYVEADFTVIYDMAPEVGDVSTPIFVRHIWPSRSQLVSDLSSRLGP